MNHENKVFLCDRLNDLKLNNEDKNEEGLVHEDLSEISDENDKEILNDMDDSEPR